MGTKSISRFLSFARFEKNGFLAMGTMVEECPILRFFLILRESLFLAMGTLVEKRPVSALSDFLLREPFCDYGRVLCCMCITIARTCVLCVHHNHAYVLHVKMRVCASMYPDCKNGVAHEQLCKNVGLRLTRLRGRTLGRCFSQSSGRMRLC